MWNIKNFAENQIVNNIENEQTTAQELGLSCSRASNAIGVYYADLFSTLYFHTFWMVHKCTNDADVNYLGCTLSFPSFLYLPQLLDHLEMHRQADSSSGISILAYPQVYMVFFYLNFRLQVCPQQVSYATATFGIAVTFCYLSEVDSTVLQLCPPVCHGCIPSILPPLK